MVYLIVGVIALVIGVLLALDVGGSGEAFQRSGERLPGVVKASNGRFVGVVLIVAGVVLIIVSASNVTQ